MSLKDTKILIPEIPGEWTQRTRSGHTNIWNDPWYQNGLPVVRMEPPQRGLYAERIEGAWYWVCGCERCLGNEKHSYITCEEHDRCDNCKCPRSALTETPWGTSTGWCCVPCMSLMRAARKSEALAAAAAKDHGEDDCCYTDTIICPYCATEQCSDDHHQSANGLICDVCDGTFDLEVEYSKSFSTTKVADGET